MVQKLLGLVTQHFFVLKNSQNRGKRMNKQVLDLFESDYPERIEELQYDSLHVCCCVFNRRGTLRTCIDHKRVHVHTLIDT